MVKNGISLLARYLFKDSLFSGPLDTDLILQEKKALKISDIYISTAFEVSVFIRFLENKRNNFLKLT